MSAPEPTAGVCDGCNVREPWEHRCFGPQCPCEECAEERALFDTPLTAWESAP